MLQGFEPTGVFARDVAECLTLQLKEKNRFDPAMAALVGNLELLARRDMAGLRRVCGVDDEDLKEMIAELRALTPRPGAAFGGEPAQAVVPDVFVREGPGGLWHVELNTDTLPKLLVDHRYHARVSAGARSDQEKTFVSDCLASANWLVKSLDQRAKTILKVASEIVRQQDGFLAFGVEHLRPLNLKTVADAIGMHESTVSRVTSNKYLATPRGVFEMKFFFTSAIASSARRRGPLGRSGAPQDPPADRGRDRASARCTPTTRSSRSSRRPASTSPGAPSPNTARRCASPPRWSASGC